MNVGNLVRSAHAFGASFVFTVAADPRAGRAPSDTSKTHSQLPFYRWPSIEDMVLPSDCVLVGVELLDEAVEESALLERAIALAEQFAALDMEAHRNTKGRARVPLNTALKQALEQELAS